MLPHPLQPLCPVEPFWNAAIQPLPRGESAHIQFQRTNRLVQGLFKGAPDRHDLAHRLHLRRKGRIGPAELLEGKAGDLHYHIVDRRLEGSLGHAGDVVGDFIQRVTHGKLRGNLGNGKPCRFRSQRGTPRHTWIHFDNHHVAVLGVQAELHVRSACIDADLTDDPDCGIPHPLVLFVREGHGRRDRDAVPRMDPHRVQVLDGTDDDDIVLEVPHHLEFIFFPPDERFLNQHLADRTHGQGPIDQLLELFPVVGDIPAGSAHGEGGTDDRGESGLFENLDGFVTVMGRTAGRHPQADSLHRLFEGFAILGLMDRLGGSADQLHAVFFERPPLDQGHRGIQRGLASHGGKQGVGPFSLDHFFHHFDRDRLHIGPIGQLRIGHDRGRIAVDENDPVAFFFQRFAGLRAGIVELAGLTDHDRAGPDQ